MFLRTGTRWVELERRTPNYNYGNVITTSNRAFNGVSSTTGPSIPRARFELVIFGAEECAGAARYNVNFVAGVGDVQPPQPGIGWVVTTSNAAEIRRGPVVGHPNMCRLFLDPSIRLPPSQYFVETSLGYYFFRVHPA